MKLIKSFHIILAILLSMYGLLGINNPTSWHLVWWFGLLTYYFLVSGVFKEKLIFIRLSIIPPVLAFLITAPLVTYNFYAFATKDTLYLDSPATMFIVAILALLVTLPSFMLLVIYWLNRNVWLQENT